MAAMSDSGAGSGALRTPTLAAFDGGSGPLRGSGLTEARTIADGVLAWEEGMVTFAGPASEMPDGLQPRSVAGALVPGFVDAHTHLPFFGWRADEFEARLAGRTYRDLHGAGGGIARSARLLGSASDEEVLEFADALAAEMLALGTTALELKTGYGLSIEGELRQARLARKLAAEIAQSATVTLLPCHAVPDGFTREEWVRMVCDELIPAAAGEGLADAVDVYVEDIALSIDDLARVAEVAQAHGLALKCHADQLGPSGAAEAAVALGARDVDHLNHLSAEGVAALGRADAIAVLLPVSTFFLRAQPPPVADLLAAGAALAVATDFNPGTSPCLSMPEAIAHACTLYRLPPLAALAAATRNGAAALGLGGRLGRLEAGLRADFLVLDSPDPAAIPYRPGHNPVAETWVGGTSVARKA
jgi:imidazolonepropionase